MQQSIFLYFGIDLQTFKLPLVLKKGHFFKIYMGSRLNQFFPHTTVEKCEIAIIYYKEIYDKI